MSACIARRNPRRRARSCARVTSALPTPAARQHRSDGNGLHNHRVDGVAALRLQDIRERHQEANESSVTLREERQLWPNEWQQRPAVVKELFLGNRRVEEVSLEARQQAAGRSLEAQRQPWTMSNGRTVMPAFRSTSRASPVRRSSAVRSSVIAEAYVASGENPRCSPVSGPVPGLFGSRKNGAGRDPSPAKR